MTRTILLPGLGADERLFEPQVRAFEHVEIPSWPTTPVQSVGQVAELLWNTIRPEAPWIIGGMSFGGQVAMELAALGHTKGCPPSAVVLIASSRDRTAIPLRFKLSLTLAGPVPAALTRPALGTLATVFSKRERLSEHHADLVRATAADLDIARLKSLARVCGNWSFTPDDARRLRESGIPIHQIHGAHDWVIPLPKHHRDSATEVIPGGRHLINLTHADLVNALLARVIGSSDELAE